MEKSHFRQALKRYFSAIAILSCVKKIFSQFLSRTQRHVRFHNVRNVFLGSTRKWCDGKFKGKILHGASPGRHQYKRLAQD